jgi:hypothetical protein
MSFVCLVNTLSFQIVTADKFLPPPLFIYLRIDIAAHLFVDNEKIGF